MMLTHLEITSYGFAPSEKQASLIRQEKTHYAMDFAQRLGRSGVAFLGISGSVSYDPAKEDDVDIFLIAENGMLWTLLLRAFIVRRLVGLGDICLSLCMESRYAERYYSCLHDPLIVEDSHHVIPLIGERYYQTLLAKIPETTEPEIHKLAAGEVVHPNVGLFESLASSFLYIPMAVFLLIKGIVTNSRLRKKGSLDETFSTNIGLDRFFLDSEKYRRLRRGHGKD